jgi:hypothetical protein
MSQSQAKPSARSRWRKGIDVALVANRLKDDHVVATRGHSFHNITISGNARVHLGDHNVNALQTRFQHVQETELKPFTVPFTRNPHFLPRGLDLLSAIKGIAHDRHNRLAFVGMGGAG